MSDQRVRWGILSSAHIARKNYQGIYNSGNGVVAAVASRDEARSQAFIDDCQRHAPFNPAPRALGSYEALIEDPGIDAVYIPLPTGLRKQWVIRAADAGKHVICEKPCGIGVGDVREMVEACERNNVQFMDGVMFMHSTRLGRIREVLDDGASVGNIKRMTSSFSFCAPEEFLSGNIRMHSDLEPHGCLGDLGWYCLRFFLWAQKGAMPREVSGRFVSQLSREDSPATVPTEFSAELFWDNGVSASFYCSFLTENQQFVSVSGDKGYLVLDDFVLPFFGDETSFEVKNSMFHMDGCNFNMERRATRHAIREYSNSDPTSQETCLFRNFSDKVLSGKPDPFWSNLALDTQRLMNAVRESAESGGKCVSIG